MIRRLLIANRGEIALRIVRACRELGIESVAVYSTIDAAAPHVFAADRAVEIGPPPSSESYLAIARLIDAARRTGADAVHPGYGFLAQNPEFADACRRAGLVFVGPPADVLARMGSKIEARRMMATAEVPLVPGGEPADQSEEAVRKAVERVGFPAIIKASAGGGGKGMRIVRRNAEVDFAIQSARREALGAFADGALYVERLIERPRHVEVQLLADDHGHFVHLFERECSIQRRHQKIVEESPCMAISASTRAAMGRVAIAAATAADYRNAGTVEFLVEGSGDAARFYFLEMNTRLQVEHPVTEMVTGVDIVRAQLLIAGGQPLPWKQDEIGQRGHAIECRVYGEDPAQDFLPAAGRLLTYREPTGPGLRVDAGVVEGSDVPVHYDPLMAKLIAYGETRPLAIGRALAALRRYVVLGVKTNISFLSRVLEHPRFQSGAIDTGFIDAERATLLDHRPSASVAAVAAAAVAVHVTAQEQRAGARETQRLSGEAERAGVDPWDALHQWRS